MNKTSIQAALKIIREQQESCIGHYNGPIDFLGDVPEPLLVERSEPEIKTQSD